MVAFCGGCQGLGSHRRHCRKNPNYTREAEWADQAEDLGDRIGPNNYAAANACYRAAGILRTAGEARLLDRAIVIPEGLLHLDVPDTYGRIDVTNWEEA